MFSGNCKIIGKQKIAERTWEYEIEKPEGFVNLSGQYIWVILTQEMFPDSRGQRRAFSLTSFPDDKSLKIVFRESDSGYKKGLVSLSIGDVVQIIGPFGSLHFPDDPTKPVVCVASGVGIAPFLSLINDSISNHKQRKIILIYANHSESQTAYNQLFQNYQQQNWQFSYRPVFGRVSQDILSKIVSESPGSKWYIIGLQGFVESISETIFSLGISEELMNYEQFYWSKNTPHIETEVINQSQINIFQLAVNQSSNHTILTDINGKIIYANSAAQKITGYSFSEMQGHTPRLWGGLKSTDFYKKLWHTIKIDKKTFVGEIANRRKNGEIYYANAFISSIINKEGNLIGFIGTEDDISHQKAIEKNLKEQIEQTEKINSVMVGRELKMVELKKRIADLELKINHEI